MKNPEDYNVRSIERALRILNCFDDGHRERGISEIADVVGLHKATTHRIVTTLLNYDFLERAEDGQKYKLGLALTKLGLRVLRQIDLREEALPVLTELNERFDESCDLSIFEQNEVFFLEVIRSNHALSTAAEVGQHLPAHSTASGKVFLAHLSEQDLDNFLSRPLRPLTANTITSPEALKEQLLQIRQQGYALDDEETEIGIRAIAAPILDHRGRVAAAVSVPIPSSRLPMDDLVQMADPLQAAALAISHRLGYSA